MLCILFILRTDNKPSRKFTIEDDSPSEQTITDLYQENCQNNGFMNQHETKLILKIHQDQASPITLFDQPKIKQFKLKLKPKYGVILPTVEMAKLGKYTYDVADEFEFSQDTEYYSMLTARTNKLDDLHIDINITGGSGSKVFNVAGRIDAKSCFETRKS